MMRSLYSGVSGLKIHQTKMDVIGNNIANVNTVGFKASRVNFSELFYQTTQTASGPNAETNTGGQNAKQIGLGASLNAISIDVTGECGTQSTGNPFDLKINGNSFFIVQSGGTNYFTKAGNFTKDTEGHLVTQSGAYVMGYVASAPGEALQTDMVRPLYVQGAQYQNTPPEATSAATYTGNINSQDPDFAENLPITTFVSVYDNLGYKYEVQIQITKNSDTEYSVAATGVYSGSQRVDGLGCSLAAAGAGDGDTGGTTLTYDGSSGLIENPADAVFTLTLTGKEAFTETVQLDFSQTTAFGSETTIDSARGDKNGNGAGKAVGEMINVGFQTDGKIVASYSNGDKEVIGQVAVASFNNPAGLQKIGDNMFESTLNSGEFNGIGFDITALGEKFSPGTVEMSNVDLATEFTDMIVTQRGFQANSRIITTSDSMIEELLSLKR